MRLEIIPEFFRALFAATETLQLSLPGLVPGSGRLSLLNLELLRSLLLRESSRQAVLALLSPAEAAHFNRFSYQKRQVEWLGGRLAAKCSLQALQADPGLDPEFCRTCSLLPDEHGRPRLETPGDRVGAAAISISHSHEFAAALACPTGLCGLDIQRRTGRLTAVQERLASAQELQILAPLPDPLNRLGLLWTAKEAVKKGFLADQPTFFGGISLISLTEVLPGRMWTARCRPNEQAGAVEVRIGLLSDYFLACTAEAAHA